VQELQNVIDQINIQSKQGSKEEQKSVQPEDQTKIKSISDLKGKIESLFIN
jgi:hypothetical protein